MRVREVAQVREEHGQVGGGIAEGSAHQHSLLAVPSAPCSLDCREIIVTNSLDLGVVAGGREAQREDWEDRGSPGREDQDREEKGDAAQEAQSMEQLSSTSEGGWRAWLETIQRREKSS